MRHKKLLRIIALLLILLTIPTTTSFADENIIYTPSSWALQKIQISKTLSILPEGFDFQPFTANITRADFCEVLINTCRIYGISLSEPPLTPTFADTSTSFVEQAYQLGLTQGTTTELFSPDAPLTREMAGVMLSRLRMLFVYNTSKNGDRNWDNNRDWQNQINYYQDTVSMNEAGILTYSPPMSEDSASESLSNYTSDHKLISSWAKTYMADVFTRGILNGIGNGNLSPKNNITREQAVLLSLNVLTYCDEEKIKAIGITDCLIPNPTGIYISSNYYSGALYLRWNDIPLATAYDVTLYKNYEPVYSVRIKDTQMDLRTSTSHYNRETKTFDVTEMDNPLYAQIFGSEKETINGTIKVTAVGSDGQASLFSLLQPFIIEAWANKNERIFGASDKSYFDSDAQARLRMTTVQLNIWRLSTSGVKTTAKISLLVNKNVAEDVKRIFADIYNGADKFPIKNIGAYAYRSGRSEHSCGTAIDINYEENYFVSWDGVIKAGLFWKPGENPYSIPVGGDVVTAFNKYGWHWSPDRHWPNGADYMHFSLSGT